VANQKLGNYYVTISNKAGCYASSDVMTIPPDGMSTGNQDQFDGMTIYPNPNPGQFSVRIENKELGEVRISVLDQGGMEIYRSKSEKTSERFDSQIDLGNPTKGIYLVNLSVNGFTVNKKIIIK